jgi:aspartate/methionine/tyrosine aminotransferase
MKIQPFRLERYFAKYEFSAPYLLCCSDCEPFTLRELISLADAESLELWNSLWLGYTESLGYPLLRQEVSKLYCGIQPEEALIITPEEGIFIAMNVILEQGDHIVVTFPGYQSLYELANSLDCEVTKWIPNKVDNGWIFSIDTLKSSIKENTKLIVVNFPHNPTGALPTKEEYRQIIEIAKEKNIALFSDEMYRYLELNSKDRLASASDLYNNAISLSGVSKSFGCAGLRIGWLTTKNKALYQQFTNFRDYTTICGSAPSEILALMALRAKEKVIDRNMRIIKRNLALLDDFFKKYRRLFEWSRPKAGSIAFPTLKSEKRIDEFCLNLVNEKGVLLLPSTVYGFDTNGFRVGFGRRNMPTALQKLGEYISENNL